MEMRQKLGALTENVLTEEDWSLVHRYLDSSTNEHGVSRDAFGLSNILTDMETALIVAQEMGTTRGSVLGVLLDKDQRYTFSEVDALIDNFMKGKVN